MASALALPLIPGVRATAACPAHLLRPRRAHLHDLATRAPPRPVSVRCAHKAGNFGGALAPGDVHGPAAIALRSVAADAFRPLTDNFAHVCSLKNVFDINDYNIGMPFGVLMASVGVYQLFKMDPWTSLDVALGYAFYKLSVLSSRVHRSGFANELITRIKFAIIVIMMIKLLPVNLNRLDIIRIPVFHLYVTTFFFDINDWKQDARYAMSEILGMIQAKLRW